MSIHLRSMKGEQARHTVSYVQYQYSPFHVKEDSEILTDGKWTNYFNNHAGVIKNLHSLHVVPYETARLPRKH